MEAHTVQRRRTIVLVLGPLLDPYFFLPGIEALRREDGTSRSGPRGVQ